MNIFWIIIDVTVAIFLITTVIVVYWRYVRRVIKVRILAKVGNRYQIIKKMNKNINKTEFKYDNGNYTIDLDKSIPDNRNFIMYWEKGKSQPLVFALLDMKYDTKMLRAITQSTIFGELLHPAKYKMLFMVIIALGIGIILVSGLSFYFYNNMMKNFMLFIQQGGVA